MPVDAGDVIYVKFPTTNAGDLAHPALVLCAYNEAGTVLLSVAYGSSKKVCASGHTPYEMVINTPKYIRLAGLREPTRFDLSVRATVELAKASKIGSLNLQDPAIFNKLRTAVLASEYLLSGEGVV